MFEGIRSALKAQIQAADPDGRAATWTTRWPSSCSRRSSWSSTSREFKATLRNLTVLMLAAL